MQDGIVIVFIQEYSDNDYSKQIFKNTAKANTGVNNDKVCNIHDMASNVLEWSTESSTGVDEDTSYPCVLRGGRYDDTEFSASVRGYNSVGFSYDVFCFRPLLNCSPVS